MFSTGHEITTSAFRKVVPALQRPGKLGCRTVPNDRTFSTRAANRLRKEAVSPGTLTNVPEDCSPASTSAARSTSKGVSTRYVAEMRVGMRLAMHQRLEPPFIGESRMRRHSKSAKTLIKSDVCYNPTAEPPSQGRVTPVRYEAADELRRRGFAARP